MVKTFGINKTLTKLGGNVIYTIETPFKNVDTIISYDDQIDGISNNSQITRYFAFSYGDDEWSIYHLVSDLNISSLVDFTKEFKLKFKFEVTTKFDELPIKIKTFDLNIREIGVEEPICNPLNSLDFSKTATIDFLEIAKPYVQLHNEINFYLNNNYGQEVKYFRTEAEAESTDVFLNEYGIKNCVEEKCIKVIIPDNKVPDPKHQYDEFGINFEEFEIHISKLYFEEQFGKDKKPRVEDFMLFPKLNRMYYIYTMYLGRGINESANFYVCSLKKYDDNTSVIKSEEVQNLIESETLSHEKIFSEQLNEEKVDMVNDQQNTQKTITQDIVRDEISEVMNIVDESISNNGTELLRSYYNMSDIPSDQVAVKYKHPIHLLEKESISYTSWLRNPTREGYVPSFNITDQQKISFSVIRITIDKPISQIGLTEFDSITRQGDVFDIDSIIDETTITLKSKVLIETTKFDEYRKSDKVNLLFVVDANLNFSMDLHNNSKVRLRFNNNVYDFDSLNLLFDKWYGFIVNISNNYNYIGVYVYEVEDRGLIPVEKYSTRLKQTYKREITKDTCLIIPDNSIPFIAGSNTHMSNIRLFKKALDLEIQSFVIGDRTVKKPSMAYIIDDADVVFNIPRIGRGDTYINDRNK